MHSAWLTAVWMFYGPSVSELKLCYYYLTVICFMYLQTMSRVSERLNIPCFVATGVVQLLSTPLYSPISLITALLTSLTNVVPMWKNIKLQVILLPCWSNVRFSMGPSQLMFSLHFAAWKHDFMLVIVHIINNSWPRSCEIFVQLETSLRQCNVFDVEK